MPDWAWAAIVWGVSLPIAFRFAFTRGFLERSSMLFPLRVMIVAYVAPALALTALLEPLIVAIWRPGR